MSYEKPQPHWQQRQDPRWQKRKSEILIRDNFKCTCCDDPKKQLHVHHRWYVSGRKVWEYPDIALVTLCEECHLRPLVPHEWETQWEAWIELIERTHTNYNVFVHSAYRLNITPEHLMTSIFEKATP